MLPGVDVYEKTGFNRREDKREGMALLDLRGR
jgi:hypothetical protein